MTKTFVPGEILTASDVNEFLVNKLVDVKHVLKTDTFSAAVGARGNVAVTGLSITHEVKDPANRLIITAYFGAAGNSAGQGQTGIAVNEFASGRTPNENVLIGIGDAEGSRTPVGAGGFVQGTGVTNSDRVVSMPSVTFVHTPGAGEKTYTAHAINIENNENTLFINRSDRNDSTGIVPRAASALVIQEVAV